MLTISLPKLENFYVRVTGENGSSDFLLQQISIDKTFDEDSQTDQLHNIFDIF